MAVFEVMEENLRATLAVFARANGSGATHQFPGVAVSSSGVQFSMFNSAVLTSPVSSAMELEHRIQTAAAFFSARGLAWSFWVCQDWIEKPVRSLVEIVFDRQRLHLVIELPAMLAEKLMPPERLLPSLEIRRVSDAETRGDFTQIMSVAFGIPVPVARAIYESERTWDPGFTGWLAYSEGLPVSSTATVVTDEVAGVYAVGTMPGYQHRGCAEAVMRHALDGVRSATGIERSILQSSEAGLAMYRKLGYRTVTRYAVFAT